MNSSMGLAEVLYAASKIKDKNKQIIHLQKHSTKMLKEIIGLCYDPRVQWRLPPGKPPYRALPKASDAQGVLKAEMRKMAIFVENPQYKDLSPLKRETQFVQLLESIDCDDAEMLCSIKDRKMPYKNLSKDLMKEAFPGISQGW
tara:strand:- start:689 stop:1120 length:432 start_codon:yes stop_codon:yes gene_type:complete